MRKPDICLSENKGADQLCSNCTADQRLCFRYSDSTIPLLLKSKISSSKPVTVHVQAGLCRFWSELPKTGFLASRLNFVRQSRTTHGCAKLLAEKEIVSSRQKEHDEDISGCTDTVYGPKSSGATTLFSAYRSTHPTDKEAISEC